jgi:superfamily I DNA/RNA helicase
MNNLSLILGGPGCGKTTRLLNIVMGHLSEGIGSEEIAFVTFTKSAATEAQERAAEKFSLDPETDLPWFRTIHSLAYKQLSLTRDEIMDQRDWIEFVDLVDERLTGTFETEDGLIVIGGREIGDKMLRLVDYAATTLQALWDVYHEVNEPVDWHRLQRFASALQFYKSDSGKLDFSDMLLRYREIGNPVPVRIAVIDEAQDLTPAQWAVVRKAFGFAERVYISGDDDQAIYSWAGADVPQFLNLSRTPEVLPVSHRLPRDVHTFAQTIAQRISSRYAKPFRPTDRAGTVEFHNTPDAVDIREPGRWFLLARNSHMLSRLEEIVRDYGIPYTKRGRSAVVKWEIEAIRLWTNRAGLSFTAQQVKTLCKARNEAPPQLHESKLYRLADLGWSGDQRGWDRALSTIPPHRQSFYEAAETRGEDLLAEPRIRIETIHGVKGGEADHVLMMTDMSTRTMESFHANPDNEHRVFYVGATRALQSLHIVLPQSDQFYPID